jgi:hypothetical protein
MCLALLLLCIGGELVRQINLGDPQVRERAMQVGEPNSQMED